MLPLDPEEAPKRQPRAERADCEAAHDQNQRRPGERERLHVWVVLEWLTICGIAISRLRNNSTTAAIEPASPVRSPSSMNGPRTYQLDAPTSFITSISRRRACTDSRIVFAMRIVEAARARPRR